MIASGYRESNRQLGKDAHRERLPDPSSLAGGLAARGHRRRPVEATMRGAARIGLAWRGEYNKVRFGASCAGCVD